MAMRINTKGLEELQDMLQELGNQTYAVAAEALYDGAAQVADAFERAAGQIQTAPFKGKRNKRKPSPEEAAALKGKTGIATFRYDEDGVNTLVGVSGSAGYTQLGNKQVAVRLIARAINSGTSFMPKQPVFRKAKTNSTAKAKKAIVDKVEERYKEIINSEG